MSDFLNLGESVGKETVDAAEKVQETADVDKLQQTAESSKPEEQVETTDDPTKNTGGLLSFVGDPLGQGLQKTLQPTLGRVTGAVVEPVVGVSKPVSDSVKPLFPQDQKARDKMGGKEQNAGNPLGL